MIVLPYSYAYRCDYIFESSTHLCTLLNTVIVASSSSSINLHCVQYCTDHHTLVSAQAPLLVLYIIIIITL